MPVKPRGIDWVAPIVLGAPVVADVDRIVTSTVIADGALSIAAQPDMPRNFTLDLIDSNSSVTAGQCLVTGLDYKGDVITETFVLVGAGGTQQIVGTKLFAGVSALVMSLVAGGGGGDLITVGIGDRIGLPFNIADASAVKNVYLGGVRKAAPTIHTGIGVSAIETSTYDGTAVLVSYANLKGF